MRRKVSPRREQSGDPAVDRIQNQLSEATRSANQLVTDLKDCPFFPGKLVSVALPGAVPKKVTHKLGVAATFFIARPNYDGTGVPASVIEFPTQGEADPRRDLIVYASDDCIVDLWFYPRASARTPQ